MLVWADVRTFASLHSQSPANIGTIVAVREFAVVVGAVLAVVILKEPMDCCKVLFQHSLCFRQIYNHPTVAFKC
eukprot:COSAG02_NODE_49826_length_324_cov_0.920000_1_plen_73_part_01